MKLTQLQLLELARRQIADANQVFIEIQRGPNPLTDAERHRLADRRPQWERFRPLPAKLPTG